MEVTLSIVEEKWKLATANEMLPSCVVKTTAGKTPSVKTVGQT